MPGPIGPASAQERSVVDEDELAKAFELRSVQGRAQRRQIFLAHPALRDHRPREAAHRVYGDESDLSHDPDPQRVRQIGVLLLGKMLFEKARRSAVPRVAVVVSRQYREARGVAGEDVERIAGAGELLGMPELRQVPRADGAIGSPPPPGGSVETVPP